MNISRINSKVRVLELSVLIEKIAVVLERNSAIGDSFITTLANNARRLSTELQNAVNSTKVYSDIEESDRLRDDSLRALFNITTGLSYFPDSEIKEGAKMVSAILDKYGLEITRGNYDKETALVKKLLADLAHSDIATTIAKLPGVSDIIEQLSMNQTKFDEAQQAWNIVRVKDEKNPSEIKKEVIPFINSVVVSFVEVAVYVNESVYKELALEIEGFIDSENRLLK